MTQISYLSPTLVPEPDQRTRLLVMGILLLGMGALSALMLLFMAVAMTMTRRLAVPAAGWKQMVPAMLMYLSIAALFVSLGVGSIARKRWVRPVVLAIAWTWLIVGACGMVAAIYVVAQMERTPATATTMPAFASGSFSAIMITTTVVFSMIFYVGLPLMLILAYKSPTVQATLDFYDPEARWTDGVPIRVLALCFYLLITAIGLLSNVAIGVAPAFGFLLTGPAAVAVFGLIAALFILAARWCYGLQKRGWWLALALFVLMPISGTITFLRISMTDMYKALGMSLADIELVEKINGMRSGQMIGWIIFGGLIGIGYALFTRSSFFGAQPSMGTGEIV